MYKIEFGWYGAIGLRMYAYIPVEHGKARWVVVHTFVIENNWMYHLWVIHSLDLSMKLE